MLAVERAIGSPGPRRRHSAVEETTPSSLGPRQLLGPAAPFNACASDALVGLFEQREPVLEPLCSRLVQESSLPQLVLDELESDALGQLQRVYL